MSILTELRTLVDGMELCNTIECRECKRTECPSDVLHDMLFDAAGEVPVLRALVAVAEAAERRRREEQRDIPYNEPVPSEEWVYADALLTDALAPLVKEADDG